MHSAEEKRKTEMVRGMTSFERALVLQSSLTLILFYFFTRESLWAGGNNDVGVLINLYNYKLVVNFD